MIVKTIDITVGKSTVEVRFADDAYINASPEEIKWRIENMQRIAGKILARHRMELAE